MWFLLDQVAWHIEGRRTSYVASLGALSTAATAVVSTIAAIGVMVYVVLTYRLWEQSRLQNLATRRVHEAAVMSQLMVEYDGMRDAVRTLQDFFKQFPTREQAVDAFRNARGAPDPNSREMQVVDPARFRVSRMFVRARKLARAGYVSRRIVFLSFNRQAIEDVFLALVDPLDEVIAVAHRGAPSLADREFYRQLLADRDVLDAD
jgi:hypothetical protein